MTIEEALQKAKEAVDNGYVMPYPIACVVLAEEVKRLQAQVRKEKKDD